jgi:hypothetical protein
MDVEKGSGVGLGVLHKDAYKGYVSALVPLIDFLEHGSLPSAEWSP